MHLGLKQKDKKFLKEIYKLKMFSYQGNQKKFKVRIKDRTNWSKPISLHDYGVF